MKRLPKKKPPLTCKELKKGLKRLGFEPRAQKGSHEQWVNDLEGRRYKVTVDCPKAPFCKILIASMARQAGVSKDRLYRACLGFDLD
jgi:predicted RNA binding protein YcfA (HicA-like mRNA interferase family)